MHFPHLIVENNDILCESCLCRKFKVINGQRLEKTHLYLSSANKKRADQPARKRSLISAFIVRYPQNIFPLLVTCKVSMF